jgi:hypothetical protein
MSSFIRLSIFTRLLYIRHHSLITQQFRCCWRGLYLFFTKLFSVLILTFLIELFSATDPFTSGMAVVPFAETHPPYVSSRGSADQQIILCTRIHNQILQRFLGRVCEYISLSISINNTEYALNNTGMPCQTFFIR